MTFKEKYKKYCNQKWNDNWYYKKISLSRIKAPFTILMGPNGCGKSMSMKLMQQTLDDRGGTYLAYSNKMNDIVNRHCNAFGDWDPNALAHAFFSEGERIKGSIDDFNNSDFLRILNETPEDKDIYIFLDEFDSGLSFDKLRRVIKLYIWIYGREIQKCPNRNLYFVFTCNSYEMLRCFQLDNPMMDIIWVPTGTKIEIKTYKQFEDLYSYYFNFIQRKLRKENEFLE